MTNIFSVGWLAALVAGVGAILAMTEVGDIRWHLVAALIISIAFAAVAIKDNADLRRNNASLHAIGASTARYMGLVWVWGALVLGLTYTLFLDPWREWLVFFLAFAAIGVLCLVFAAALQRDAESGSDDKTMLKLGRYLTIAQLAGMAATILGIAIDPDKSIISTARPDWAANIVFVFGAIALIAISAYALWRQRNDPT